MEYKAPQPYVVVKQPKDVLEELVKELKDDALAHYKALKYSAEVKGFDIHELLTAYADFYDIHLSSGNIKSFINNFYYGVKDQNPRYTSIVKLYLDNPKITREEVLTALHRKVQATDIPIVTTGERRSYMKAPIHEIDYFFGGEGRPVQSPENKDISSVFEGIMLRRINAISLHFAKIERPLVKVGLAKLNATHRATIYALIRDIKRGEEVGQKVYAKTTGFDPNFVAENWDKGHMLKKDYLMFIYPNYVNVPAITLLSSRLQDIKSVKGNIAVYRMLPQVETVEAVKRKILIDKANKYNYAHSKRYDPRNVILFDSSKFDDSKFEEGKKMIDNVMRELERYLEAGYSIGIVGGVGIRKDYGERKFPQLFKYWERRMKDFLEQYEDSVTKPSPEPTPREKALQWIRKLRNPALRSYMVRLYEYYTTRADEPNARRPAEPLNIKPEVLYDYEVKLVTTLGVGSEFQRDIARLVEHADLSREKLKEIAIETKKITEAVGKDVIKISDPTVFIENFSNIFSAVLNTNANTIRNSKIPATLVRQLNEVALEYEHFKGSFDARKKKLEEAIQKQEDIIREYAVHLHNITIKVLDTADIKGFNVDKIVNSIKLLLAEKKIYPQHKIEKVVKDIMPI